MLTLGIGTPEAVISSAWPRCLLLCLIALASFLSQLAANGILISSSRNTGTLGVQIPSKASSFYLLLILENITLSKRVGLHFD